MNFGLLFLLLAFFLPYLSKPSTPSPRGICNKSKLFAAQNVVAWSTTSRVKGLFYRSGLAIDADGAFRAYHPNDRLGLDSLAHAGRRGNWWALVTDMEKRVDVPSYRGSRIRLRDIMCLPLPSMTPTIPIPEIRIDMWTQRRFRTLCFTLKL
jgi:hypothetical protein